MEKTLDSYVAIFICLALVAWIFVMIFLFENLNRFKEADWTGYEIVIECKNHSNILIQNKANEFLKDEFLSRFEEIKILELRREFNREQLKKKHFAPSKKD